MSSVLPPFHVEANGSLPIPPTLHQVWVGSHVPLWVGAAWERWDEALESYGGPWRALRWTEATILGTPLERTLDAARRLDLHPRGIADLLRVQAVSMHGGFYMDSDMVPLGQPLPTDLAGWVLSTPESQHQSVLCNGAFGFHAGHPFLATVRDHAVRALARGVRNEHFIAGPRAFRYAYDRHEVTVHWALTMWKKKAERKAVAAGADLNTGRLRYEATDLRAVHVGTDGEATQ